jgi:hypothetical protein
MRMHVLTCSSYIALFQTTPGQALGPEAEFLRWRAEDRSPEARAKAKEVLFAAKFAELDKVREAQTERWTTKASILDD